MDYGLVSGSSPARKRVLRQRQPYHQRPGAELRPADARRPHSAQGDQGRFISVRAELLPALPTGGAHAPPGRYRYVPHRVSLHRSPRNHGASDPGIAWGHQREGRAPWLTGSGTSRTSSSSGATTSASRTSAPTPTA